MNPRVGDTGASGTALAPGFGENRPFIARWDLDKTYLRTEFDTFRDLARTAIERPDLKRAVPGATSVLRELSHRGTWIHILSGSPRQMRRNLEEKLRIDGVLFDELTLKPNLSNLLRLRFRAVRDQLGYKLPMLLEARVRDQQMGTPSRPIREVLIGDDVEADAFVYALFAGLCEGRVSRTALEEILEAGSLYDDAKHACVQALARLEHGPVVERILIHLDRQTPPSQFANYGSRLVPFYNFLQAAFILLEDQRLDGSAVLRIANEFVRRHRFDAEALSRSYLDLLRRGHARGNGVNELSNELVKSEALFAGAVTEMVERIRGYLDNPPPFPERPEPSIDYVALARQHQGGKNRRHRRWQLLAP